MCFSGYTLKKIREGMEDNVVVVFLKTFFLEYSDQLGNVFDNTKLIYLVLILLLPIPKTECISFSDGHFEIFFCLQFLKLEENSSTK